MRSRARRRIVLRDGGSEALSGSRRAGLVAALCGDFEPAAPRLPLVTAGCIDLIDVSGAAVALMTEDLNRHVVHAAGPVTGDLEELEVALGEGPFVDAYVTGRPALEADLRHRCSRWPVFAPRAVELGALAVFALPLQAKGTRVGTLDLYRDRPGMLAAEELAIALLLAEVVTEVVLELQADVPPGLVHDQLIDADGLYAARVHQASGIVAAQLGVTVTVALARLRAYAFVEGRSLSEVAELVLRGRVRIA